MKKKKLACTFLLIVAILSVAVIPASASNHLDTYFYDVTVPRSTFSSIIPYRTKENTTPLYLKIISVYYSMLNVNVQAVGVRVPGGEHPNTIENLTYSNGQIVNKVSAYEGHDYLIRSLIYERGYRFASLRFMTGAGHSITLHEGKWSPDSIGSYEYAK